MENTWIYRASRSRTDTLRIGQLVWLRDQWVTVVGGVRKYRDDDDDQWMVGAYARPATEAEARPAIAARASRLSAREAQNTLIAAIGSMPSLARGAGKPSWATADTLAWRERRDGIGITLYLSADGAASYRPDYDDDPQIKVALAGTPEFDAVRAALAAAADVAA